MSSDFLLRFFVMMIAVALTSLLGGVIGIGSGVLMARNSKFARMAIRFLRLGLWFPFLVSWVFWSSWIPAVTAVILASCYYYLSAKLTGVGLPQVIRSTVLQALLFLLVSQVWLGREYGWDWFMEGALGYSVLILAVFLFFLDRFFRSDFDQAAKQRGAILVKQLGSRGSPPWGKALLAGACIIPSLFFTGPIWKDIGISLFEMLGGLVLAGCIALIFVRGLSANVAAKRWAFMLLPLTLHHPHPSPTFFAPSVGSYPFLANNSRSCVLVFLSLRANSLGTARPTTTATNTPRRRGWFAFCFRGNALRRDNERGSGIWLSDGGGAQPLGVSAYLHGDLRLTHRAVFRRRLGK